MIRTISTLVQNYLEMPGTENAISASDYTYNESVRRSKKNYTTKIHILEKPSQDINFHIEGSSQMLKTVNLKRPRILTIPKPEDKNEIAIIDVLNASREVERRSSHTDLSKLFRNSRKPHPVFTEREIKDIKRSEW